ncbi:DUF2177 family protein [Maritimibacter sp. UBA3975]|uniref:DUF2177 family protein n=1 Tax=Maritimibacter sp. UBA3975 TaxID=1946833 RepID=UPI000C0A0EFE|nr:DUF2177 family protein [Maritimibacter sp. UBA3975]MAM60934.1 hypothetical protein [Maritimibacter sp.]|tara:strand:+ start:7295 stop:7693 length:399 start_codon:yes stop_codon:yes gene_type:complete
MQPVLLYIITAVLFLGIDAVMLNKVMKPLFDQHLGDWLQMPIRIVPAAVFYLFYVGGLVWLVSLPALKNDTPVSALIGGAVIGAMAYGTYEFTNYATLRLWAPQMVATDVIWGTVLTGFCAWAGVMIVRAVT